MHRLFPGLWLFVVTACGSRPPPLEPGAASATPPVEVRTYGSLQDMFERGATRPVVSLASLKGERGLVGLGSLSGLRGEIAIVPGGIWVSQRNDDGSSSTKELGAGDETAAFLVAASVTEWQPIPLAENVPFDDLPDAIEELAGRAGVDVSRPFPLLIDGPLANLELNVVDGRAFPSGVKISREALMVSAAKSKFDSVEGTIVGFFGAGRPDFLHPETQLHLHVLVPSKNQMGHVDHVDLPRGATVRVPVSRR